MKRSLNMFIWWLIFQDSIPEVHRSWATPILAYLHAPKNCMLNCMRLQFGLLSQTIACICNFYTHATFSWWVSLNSCGPQECCRGSWTVKHKYLRTILSNTDISNFPFVFFRVFFVFIKMDCPPSNLIGIHFWKTFWLYMTKTHPYITWEAVFEQHLNFWNTLSTTHHLIKLP